MGPLYEGTLGVLGRDQQELFSGYKRAGRGFGTNGELPTAYTLEAAYSERTERQRAGAQTWDAQSPLPFRRTCGLAGYVLFLLNWLLIVQYR